MKKAKAHKKAKTFKEEYDHRIKIKALNECSWFCLVWGFLLFAICAYRAMCTEGVPNIIYIIASLSGLCLLVLGIAVPLKLQKIIGCIKTVCSVFGNAVLKVLLLPVYFAMMLINAFRHKKYTAKFGFKSWEDRHQTDGVFCDFRHSVQDKQQNSTVHTVVDVLSFFIENGMYIVIPILIILLIIGAVMFFVSSSAVFSFVYSLF